MTADEMQSPAREREVFSRRRRRVVAALGVGVLAVAAAAVYREATRRPGPQLEPAPAGTAVFPLHREPRPLPPLAFEDANGRALSLADFRGKLVLLNVWATWCPPCRKEMPTLDRLQARLGGPEFEVVALSIDQGGPGVVKSFFDSIGVRALKLYIDSRAEAMLTLGIAGIPTTLLIDREGRELGRKVGPAEWDSADMVGFIQSRIGAGTPAEGTRREPRPWSWAGVRPSHGT
jgi:thiol-disulfide isomerase/thioredoxin